MIRNVKPCSKSNNRSPLYNYGSTEQILSSQSKNVRAGTSGQHFKNRWNDLAYTALIDQLRLYGNVRFKPEVIDSFSPCYRGSGYNSKRYDIWTSIWPGAQPVGEGRGRFIKLNPSKFSHLQDLLSFILSLVEVNDPDDLKLSSVDVALDSNFQFTQKLQLLNFKSSLKYQTFGEHGRTETIIVGRSRGGRRAKTIVYDKSKQMKDVRKQSIPITTRIEKRVPCFMASLSKLAMLQDQDHFDHISLCEYKLKDKISEDLEAIVPLFETIRLEIGPWATRRRLKQKHGYSYQQIDRVVTTKDLGVPLSQMWREGISPFFKGGHNVQ